MDKLLDGLVELAIKLTTVGVAALLVVEWVDRVLPS
jgi:hypothetical protein